MCVRVFIFGLACAAALFGQRKFSWQNYCFDHPAAIVCRGNDYAVKQPPGPKDTPRSVMPNAAATAPESARPPIVEAGQIDWRFADPAPDALAGINFSKLAVSTLAYNLILQLGSKQGLTEPDVRRLFEGLAHVDQVALSIRDNRAVIMLTGSLADAALPKSEPGWKAVPLPGGAMLVGHAGAVDQAMKRINTPSAPAAFAQLAAERQAANEFWAAGAARIIGPQAVSAGAKRFSLTASLSNGLSSDLAFEFDGAPDASALETWQSKLGATVEGATVHVRTSLDAAEAQQKLGEIAAGPLGQPMAALVGAARYLPVRDTTPPKHDKPLIYGLDGGPKEVNQLPRR